MSMSEQEKAVEAFEAAVSPAALADAEHKLRSARTRLVLRQPFFATLLLSMPLEVEWGIPSMGTDGRRVVYNPSFVNNLTLDEAVFVYCHEALHCVFQHMLTVGSRDKMLWNIAADYVINDLLVTEDVGKMPACGLHNPDLVKRGGGTTEGVYDLLPKNSAQGGPGAPGGSPMLGDIMSPPGGGSEAEQSALAAELKIRVANAAATAKMQGKLTAGIERFVDELMKPKVDWRETLRRFITARAKVDYTFARPKRRFLAEDIILPSLSGESMGKIAIAVDCSGSIGAEELREFAAEMTAIKEDCCPAEVHVIYFDSTVCHYDKFDRDEELHVAPHGGGGTAFSPIFSYIEDEDIDPVCCVVLTDLCCSDFGPPPPYPVLWITTAATAAPWGEIVEMKG